MLLPRWASYRRSRLHQGSSSASSVGGQTEGQTAQPAHADKARPTRVWARLAWLYLQRSATTTTTTTTWMQFELLFLHSKTRRGNKRRQFSRVMSEQGESHGEKVDIYTHTRILPTGAIIRAGDTLNRPFWRQGSRKTQLFFFLTHFYCNSNGYLVPQLDASQVKWNRYFCDDRIFKSRETVLRSNLFPPLTKPFTAIVVIFASQGFIRILTL